MGKGLTVTGPIPKLLSSPINNYQMIFYLSCLTYGGSNSPTFNITGKVTAPTTFTITYTSTVDTPILALHGSVIIFD
jgi:hypothetical protein